MLEEAKDGDRRDMYVRRIDELEVRLLQLQIDAIRQNVKDHEERMRRLEDTATRFNFLLYLTMGGGLISIINLLGMAFLIVQASGG